MCVHFPEHEQREVTVPYVEFIVALQHNDHVTVCQAHELA